jgi:hypothetical protein
MFAAKYKMVVETQKSYSQPNAHRKLAARESTCHTLHHILTRYLARFPMIKNPKSAKKPVTLNAKLSEKTVD